MIFAANPLTADGMILIEPKVVAELAEFRQLKLNSPESGGILLGFRRGSHIHVVEFTSPQPGDKQSRTSFDRVSGAHQQIAIDRWAASDSRMDYVGEWHTHPERCPTPSGIDAREWHAIYSSRSMPMLFAILGTQRELWLGVGVGNQLLRVSSD